MLSFNTILYAHSDPSCSFSKFPVLSGVICQLHPYRSVVDPLLVCYKDLKMAGRAQPAVRFHIRLPTRRIACSLYLSP